MKTTTLHDWLIDAEARNLSIKKRLRMFVRIWDGKATSIANPPVPTLIENEDQFVAALAEHLSLVCQQEAPQWTNSEPLGTPFFPGGTSIRALAESPVSFRRRHIFISQADFPELWAQPFRNGLRLPFGKKAGSHST